MSIALNILAVSILKSLGCFPCSLPPAPCPLLPALSHRSLLISHRLSFPFVFRRSSFAAFGINLPQGHGLCCKKTLVLQQIQCCSVVPPSQRIRLRRIGPAEYDQRLKTNGQRQILNAVNNLPVSLSSLVVSRVNATNNLYYSSCYLNLG